MIAVLALIANFSFAGVSTIDFTKLTVTTVSDENNKENNGYTFTSGDFNFTTKKKFYWYKKVIESCGEKL